MPMVKAALTIEHGLLGFVRQHPLHGYEIAQRLRATEELGLRWGWKQSQVYAELLYLEQAGYLTSEVEAQESRPPRKVFHLTPVGAAAFEQWIASPVPHGRDFQLEFPAKLYFAQQEGGGAARALVSRQQQACQSWLDGMRDQPPHEAGQDYARLVQQFRISQIETIIAWLATCAKQFTEAGDA